MTGNMFNKNNITLRFSLIFSILIFSCSISCSQTDSAEVIEKNTEIFGSYLKILASDYVDRISTTPLLHKGIDAINQALDPYTAFFDEQETKDRYKAWEGYLFSGIGVSIYERDSLVTISELYKNCPAEIAGLRAGDQITALDSVSMKGVPFAEVVKKIKGAENTAVLITVKRPGVGNIDIPVVRKNIISKSVTWYGMINDSIGYIRCSQFLINSYDSMLAALNSLRNNSRFNYLILDLRDNTGGLVQDAVNTANLFLPKGKLICDLKSDNHKETDYNYTTLYEPVDTTLKIVALSSNVTVSAGEILLGALQDYDRAVIIGQRTFGKGYVQGTRNLAHGCQLYVTGARYYTPSGRCIQELDYTHKYLDGKVNKINDSVKPVFYTRNKRKVNACGGIEPDVKSEPPAGLPEAVSLLNNNFITGDFATLYRNTHEQLPDIASFSLPQKDWNYFFNTAVNKLPSLVSVKESEINNFETSLEKDGACKHCRNEINKIKRKLKKEKLAGLRKNADILKALLEKEILIRYYNFDAIIKYSFFHSPEIEKAIEIFRNGYYDILKY